MTEPTSHNTPPKVRPELDRGPQRQVHVAGVESWQRIARRIRVPLGFLTAAVYLFEVVRRAPHPAAIAWSFALVLPGLALRALASGTVKKNQELSVTGPYAYTRNPLYLGSTLIAAGFAVALLELAIGAASRGGVRCNLHSGDRVGGAVSSHCISWVRRLLPQRAPVHPAPDARQADTRDEPHRRFPARYQCGYGRFFVRALPEAPRVQFCLRGRTALPEPALPATGAGYSFAPDLVSASANLKSNGKGPGQSMRNRATRSRAEH